MFEKRRMYRQGDVLLQQVDSFSKELSRSVDRDDQGRLVLVEGEATGHVHAIHNPSVTAWLFQEPVSPEALFLDIPKFVELVHEEHDTIIIEPGQYKVIRQREWSDEDQRHWTYVQD